LDPFGAHSEGAQLVEQVGGQDVAVGRDQAAGGEAALRDPLRGEHRGDDRDDVALRRRAEDEAPHAAGVALDIVCQAAPGTARQPEERPSSRAGARPGPRNAPSTRRTARERAASARAALKPGTLVSTYISAVSSPGQASGSVIESALSKSRPRRRPKGGGRSI